MIKLLNFFKKSKYKKNNHENRGILFFNNPSSMIKSSIDPILRHVLELNYFCRSCVSTCDIQEISEWIEQGGSIDQELNSINNKIFYTENIIIINRLIKNLINNLIEKNTNIDQIQDLNIFIKTLLEYEIFFENNLKILCEIKFFLEDLNK